MTKQEKLDAASNEFASIERAAHAEYMRCLNETEGIIDAAWAEYEAKCEQIENEYSTNSVTMTLTRKEKIEALGAVAMKYHAARAENWRLFDEQVKPLEKQVSAIRARMEQANEAARREYLERCNEINSAKITE